MDTVLSNRSIRSIFSHLSPPLPCELITHILDLAEKWHRTLSLSLQLPHAPTPLRITETRDRTHTVCGDHILLTSPPLTRHDASQLRRLAFTLTSRDQGWSSYRADHGSYANSWTYFDVAVLPVEDPNAAPQALGEYSYRGTPPRRHCVQRNRHAGKEMESYAVELRRAEWREGLGEVREGERVALVACARFPGWVNRVQAAGMEFWSAEVGE